MLRVSRTKKAETLPAARERRAPRVLIPEGQISVTVLVKAEVVRGEVSEAELVEWIQQSVAYYYRFRNGWVGLGAVGGITVPEIISADDT